MIPRSILSHARPTLLLVLIAVAMPAPGARSQDRTMQDRLDRLERDLSMLQRQVYRGGPTPIANPGSSAAVDTELRMDRLETQMRELTGRVEDAINGVEQLQRRLEQINSDIDVRLTQGQGQPRNLPLGSQAAAGFTDTGPPGPLTMRGSTPGSNALVPRPPGSLTPPGTLVPPPPDPPTSGGTLTSPGPRQSTSEPTNVAVGGLRPPSGGALPGGSALDQYNFIQSLLKQADYPKAEEALKSFITQHPGDPLVGSAQYWLGETYYERGKYTEAARAYAEGYKRYPKGAKAADCLLKVGMALARANQKHDACVALAQLDHDFPNPGSAIKERSATEKKRLGC